MISDAEFLNAICRDNFDAFAQKAFGIVEPGTLFEWSWHIGCISEHLEALNRGEITRLIINLPPRFLKSYLVSAAFPAWVLGKNPHEKFIVTGYGATVVEQNARNCRMIMRSEWYHQLVPTRINPDMDRLTHFETTERGQYYAATALSPIVGLGAGIILIDDPIKPMEAFSETIRNSTNQNIRTTLFSRLNDRRTGKIAMIMQRAHEDDPTGNLLKDGGWTHVKLPVETKSRIVITLKDKTWKMEEGELLFPARLNRAALDKIRQDLTELNYVGQFLQEPVPSGGGDFRPEWVQFYAPGACKPKEMNICILVDPAGGEELNRKKKKLSDWTAMMVVGLAPDNNRYLLDIIRDRLNPTERVNTLFMLHRKWNALAGKSPRVGYERYGMKADTHYIEIKKREDAYNFPLIEVGGNTPKEDRIKQLIPDLQNGRWYFPQNLIYVDGEGRRFDLVQEMLTSEMPNFPRARFDDCLDALSRIYDPSLSMVFPKPKIGRVAKARREASETAESWMDF